MKIETAAIWNEVVVKVMENLQCSRKAAEYIVDSKEAWLVDMVEAMDETNADFLAECILDENDTVNESN